MIRLFCMTVLLSACGGVPPAAPVNPTHEPLGDWMGDETETSIPPATGPGADPATPTSDRCDGVDNDWDGEVDEDFAPGSCDTEYGEAGELACLGGVVRCAVCEPGELRAAACECGVVTRVDTCDERGRWVEGPCDGCPDPKRVPCGFCGHVGEDGACLDPGECQPGDRMVRRCDACPTEAGCGANSCVGEKVECSNQCRWEIVEPCAVRQPICNRDEVRQETCGQCGTVDVTCDGCFWTYARACDERGECFRGTTVSVPCGNCGEDWRAATARCNAECQWTESNCGGCRPGMYTREHGCACSDATRTEQYRCEVREAPNSCGVGVGVEVDHTWLNDCPPVPCYPGQSDTNGDQCRYCDENCEWSGWADCGAPDNPTPPGEPNPCACTEGATRTVSCPSLCNYTTTETCHDCQWVRSPCPPCST